MLLELLVENHNKTVILVPAGGTRPQIRPQPPARGHRETPQSGDVAIQGASGACGASIAALPSRTEGQTERAVMFFQKSRCNALKTLKTAKRIQEKPRKYKVNSLV